MKKRMRKTNISKRNFQNNSSRNDERKILFLKILLVFLIALISLLVIYFPKTNVSPLFSPDPSFVVSDVQPTNQNKVNLTSDLGPGDKYYNDDNSIINSTSVFPSFLNNNRALKTSRSDKNSINFTSNIDVTVYLGLPPPALDDLNRYSGWIYANAVVYTTDNNFPKGNGRNLSLYKRNFPAGLVSIPKGGDYGNYMVFLMPQDEISCSNGIDDNGLNGADCADTADCGVGIACATGRVCNSAQQCAPPQGAATCPNGSIDTSLGEVCDGPLLGGQTCQTQNFASGNLLCASNCNSFDTSSCVPIIPPNGESLCSNSIDDDNDGFKDCEDADCLRNANCLNFSDEFSNPTLTASNWNQYAGVWNIVNEKYSPSNDWMPINLLNVSETNYILSTKISSTSITDRNGGLIFRYSNKTVYYGVYLQGDNAIRFQFGNDRNNCGGAGFPYCSWVAIPSSVGGTQSNRSYNLTVIAKNENATVYVNNILVGSKNLTKLTPDYAKPFLIGGKIGLASFEPWPPVQTNNVFFDDFAAAGARLVVIPPPVRNCTITSTIRVSKPTSGANAFQQINFSYSGFSSPPITYTVELRNTSTSETLYLCNEGKSTTSSPQSYLCNWSIGNSSNDVTKRLISGINYSVYVAVNDVACSNNGIPLIYLTPVCGDGVKNGVEECDQGNNNIANGDGCSYTCAIEAGWTCLGEPSNCVLGNPLRCSIDSPTDIITGKVDGGEIDLGFSYGGNASKYRIYVENYNASKTGTAKNLRLCNHEKLTNGTLMSKLNITENPETYTCSWADSSSAYNNADDLIPGIYSATVIVYNSSVAESSTCSENAVYLLDSCEQCGSFGIDCSQRLCHGLSECFWNTARNSSGDDTCNSCSEDTECSDLTISSCALRRCNLNCTWQTSSRTCIPRSGNPPGGNNCIPVWNCDSWSSCSEGTQTRECTDSHDCGVTTNKPAESQSCGGGTIEAVCGNGIPEIGEQCDDGNTVSDDGCSPTCTNERGGNGSQLDSSLFLYILIGALAFGVLLIIIILAVLIMRRKPKQKPYQPSQIQQPQQQMKQTPQPIQPIQPKPIATQPTQGNQPIKKEPNLDKLTNFIKDARKKGYNDEQIKKSLLSKGWKSEYLKKAGLN